MADPTEPRAAPERERALTAALQRERGRLWRYIRRRVNDDADAEDVLQDVFGELIEAYRALLPIEQVGAWLMRVARNRLIDRFRRRRHEYSTPPGMDGEDEGLSWEDLLPDPSGGPEAAYTREALLAELQQALTELPETQREAFLAHEVDGESFNAMAKRTGVALNTLLARKHTAVLHLRRRLSALRDALLDGEDTHETV